MKAFFKIFAAYIAQCLMRVAHIFPIKRNRVVFTSFAGEQYACNPKYISEYLEKVYPGEFEIVWFFRHPEQYAFLSDRGIQVVRYSYFSRLRYESTAAVSVINAGDLYSWTPLRKGQLHINTWHGGGYYKLVGASEAEFNRFEKKIFRMDSKNTSEYLSTNQCFTDNEIRKDFYYNGDVLNIGFPRNDIFFQDNYDVIRQKVYKYFGIKDGCKVMMYAPTWRYDDEKEIPMPDFEGIKKAASRRFGGEWIVLVRMHYYSNSSLANLDVYDASARPDAPDMQELLVACDMLLTDYSSCIWDYSFTYRPCLLFVPDLDEYTAKRGFGIDIYEWGFPVCKTQQELYNTIENFDEAAFRAAMEHHHQSLGSFEHGDATEKVGKLIYDTCFSEKGDK